MPAASDFDKGLELYGRGDFEAAYEIWLPIAEQGDAEAQMALGYMFYNGEGVGKDYETAHRWYSRAAEQGETGAQYDLGILLARSDFSLKHDSQAYMWLEIAEARGAEGAGRDKLGLQQRMSATDIETARQRARQCLDNYFKEC